MTGVMGGFTTFSAFSLDTLDLWKSGAAPVLFSLFGNVLLSLLACAGGVLLARQYCPERVILRRSDCAAVNPNARPQTPAYRLRNRGPPTGAPRLCA